MSEEQNITEENAESEKLKKKDVNESTARDKSIEQTQPSIAHQQPPTENMEVHHHPDMHHRKKHWKEYFLEFIMIFLAVSMGFFAENIREGIIENTKAEEYAQSLYGDLKVDTSFLNFSLEYKLWRGLKIDSLISILSSEDVQKSAKLIYYYHSIMEGNIPFTPNDATIHQLSNSGGLRYFKNPQLYRAIATYDGVVNFYIEREKGETGQVPFNLAAKIFQSDILMSMHSMTHDPRDAIHIPVGNPQLLTTDKQILNEYLLYVVSKKQDNELSLMILHSLVEKNLNELMIIVRKEYNLE